MRRQLPAAPKAPIHVVEDSAYQRIKRTIWDSLDRWEQAGAPGSARPVFDRAWANALRLEAVPHGHQITMVREKMYQRWLREGIPLTAESREAILETRPRARAVLDGLGIGKPAQPIREPGQEG